MNGFLYLLFVLGFCLACDWYVRNQEAKLTGATKGVFEMYDEVGIHEAAEAERLLLELRRCRRLGKKAMAAFLEANPQMREIEEASKGGGAKKKPKAKADQSASKNA
jgi:hypothetical protein